eukprot:TRINITY_DN25603_c0_g1_i3.p1 TRINITY_DN25603_c0_g1~~TRINITY_DN25603_c0_g1_i3.p1  ORF type:complete len:400 (-),score=73.96 TRINITY_DN25603_c0_g1_i3:423-1622(-)
MERVRTSSIRACFVAIRNARVAAGMWRSARWCATFVRDMASELEAVAQRSSDRPTADALLKHYTEGRRFCSEKITEDHDQLIRLLISLDEMYYRLFYLSLSDPTARLPDLCAYFNGWAWQAAPGTLDAFANGQQLSENARSSLQQVWGFPLAGTKLFDPTRNPNPLLTLLQARWLESCERFGSRQLSGLSVCVAKPSCKGQIVTMKGGDPRCEPLLSAWRDSCRDYACHLFAFAVPNDAALEELCSHGDIVEVGAGLGYWASLMAGRGVQVAAYDKHPTSKSMNEYHGRARAWYQVLEGDTDVVCKQPGKALFLCYPPPASPMALSALRMYLRAGGQTVLHVGEWQGDTGTVEFQQELLRSCQLVRRVKLPNWGNTCYELTVWSPGPNGTTPARAPMHA